MAVINKMICKVKGSLFIIKFNCGNSLFFCKSIGNYKRDIQILWNAGYASGVAGNINNTVDLYGFKLINCLLNRIFVALVVIPLCTPFRVKAQVFKNSLVMVFIKIRHDSVNDSGRTELRKVINNDSDRVCLCGTETSCHIIRTVTGCLDDF